jgi:hypothetical protein
VCIIIDRKGNVFWGAVQFVIHPKNVSMKNNSACAANWHIHCLILHQKTDVTD